MSLKGIEKVVSNLNREIAKIEKRSARGLTVAALRVRRDSQKKTPVDEGNLRASAFTETFKASKGPAAVVGYTAEYALWVHEAPGTLKGLPRPKKKGSSANRGRYWDPQGRAEPKFLEKSAKENEKNILEDIRRHVFVK